MNFFPLSFQLKTVTQLAASAADRKTGALSKEHLLSLEAQDAKVNSDNICHSEHATELFQSLKLESERRGCLPLCRLPALLWVSSCSLVFSAAVVQANSPAHRAWTAEQHFSRAHPCTRG